MTTDNKQDRPLTGKQTAFVEAYTDFGNNTYLNATQSAITAGYSARTANKMVARLLVNVGINRAIGLVMDKRKQTGIANRAQRQQFWTDVLDAKANNMSDRLRASELLGRSEADFTDNINTTDKTKQKEIDQAKAEEAQKVATIRLEDYKKRIG